jgi:V8-like Glu-specific endopeptidase
METFKTFGEIEAARAAAARWAHQTTGDKRMENAVFKVMLGVGLLGCGSLLHKCWVLNENRKVRRHLVITQRPVGFFCGKGGDVYYRREHLAPVFRVVPKAVKALDLMDGKDHEIEHEFVREKRKIEPAEVGDESILAESTPPRPSVNNPPWMVALAIEGCDGTATVVGGGVRLGDWLLTARHVFESPKMISYMATNVIFLAGGKQAEATLERTATSFVVAPGNKEYSMTWKDLALYKVGDRAFKSVGARSLKWTDLTYYPSCSVSTFGAPDGTMMTATGHVVTHVELEAKSGVFAHTCSTTQGWSGSPVVTNVMGATKIVGIHITGGTNANYAVTSTAVVAFLRNAKMHNGAEPLEIPCADDNLYRRFKQACFPDDIQDEGKHAQGAIGGRQYQGRKRFMDLDDRWDDAIQEEVDQRLHGHGIGEGGPGDHVYEDEAVKIPKEEAIDEFRFAFSKWMLSEQASRHTVTDAGLLWVRRVACWGLHPQSRKIMTYLINTGEMTASNSSGESWIAFVDTGGDPPLPSTPPLPRFVSVDTGEKFPLPSAPPLSGSAPANSTVCPSEPGVSEPVFVPDKKTVDQGVFAPCGSWEPSPGEWALPFEEEEGKLVHWAQNVDECRPPIVPAYDGNLKTGPNITKTSEEADHISWSADIQRNMDDWFMHYDEEALGRLKGVGAKTLLKHVAFTEYRQYLEAGNKVLWDNYDGKHKNTVKNQLGKTHSFRLGSCDVGFGANADAKPIDEDYLKACAGLEFFSGSQKKKLDAVLQGYCLPPTGPKAVKESFRGQCGRQQPGTWAKLRETPNFVSRVKEFCAEYPMAKTPLVNKRFLEAVELYCDAADATKSAGWSSRYKSGAKGAWTLDSEGRSLLAYFVACRLALRMAEGDNIHWLSPKDMLELGLRDPEEAFVKKEAHDETKTKSKRWRLIWICSVVDSVCQDALHHAQNKEDILAYATEKLHSQAVGMGHHDDGLARMGKTFDVMTQQGTKNVAYSDASGWDLSVCRDALYFDAHRRVSRMKDVSWVVKDLMMAEAATNSTHVIVIGKELWTFYNFGVTATGIPSTSAQNSPIRSFTLIACGADAACAVGDDEAHTGDVDKALLATTGIIIKEGSDGVTGPTGPIDMTSHLYVKVGDTWTATFNNFAKLMAHLSLRNPNEAPSQDTLGGLRFALRHTEWAEKIFLTVCARMGWYVPAAKYSEGVEL